MRNLVKSLRRSRWGLFGLIVVLLVIASLVSYGAVLKPSDVKGNVADRQTGGAFVEARNESITREIPVTGSIVFPNSVDLTFSTSGEVGEIFVLQGQQVIEGQILAQLDSLNIADLEVIVAAERVNLQEAQAVLNALLVSKPLGVARAESALADAAVVADETKEALDDLLEPYPMRVVLAAKSVAESEKTLDEAIEFLEDLLEPKEIDTSLAEKRVAAAKVEVDDAQEAYDDIRDGSFPIEDVRDARNSVVFAITQVNNGRRSLQNAQLQWDNNIRLAENKNDEASEEYSDLFRFWLGTELTEEEMRSDIDALIQAWGIDLDSLFDRRNPVYSGGTPRLDDPITRWNEFTVWAWLNLYPGATSIQGSCDVNEFLGLSERCVSREFDDLFDVYDEARDNLATVKEEALKTLDTAQDAVTAAEDRLADAQDDLVDIEDGPDPSEVEDVGKRLKLAQASLKEALEDLKELVEEVDRLDIARAETDLAVAQAVFEEAKEDLDSMIDDELDLDQAKKLLALSLTDLELAKVRLQDAHVMVTRQTALAKARVKSAQEEVDEALEDLKGAFLEAPFSGIVFLVNAEAEDQVDDESRVIELVDPSEIEIDALVGVDNSEFVRLGTKVLVTIESVSGQTLDGVVNAVQSAPSTERGVVSLPFTIWVDVPESVKITSELTPVSVVIIHEDPLVR